MSINIPKAVARDKFESLMSFEEAQEMTYWFDHTVEFPGRFRETDTGIPELVDHEPYEGDIMVHGTPLSAYNFNIMTWGIWTLFHLYRDLADELIKLKTDMSVVTGATETDGFTLSISHYDFEIIEGWHDVENNRVVIL